MYVASRETGTPAGISDRPLARQPNVAQLASSKTDYNKQTLRPIVCLAFVLPMLLIYELGSIFTDQMSAKSGVDQWFHWIMDHVGIGHLVILPLVTAGVLLYWHHCISDDWRVRPAVLFGMLIESSCLGVILFFAGNAVYQIVASDLENPAMAILGNHYSGNWSSTIAFIGCGVYEELIFRLILLNGLIYAARMYFPDREARTICIVATSLIFAGLHYDFFNPAGAIFDINGFLFRFFASLIFCILFLTRGFGIAVGTHAIYDVMTQL